MEPKQVLMCSPTYFGVSYDINPHMKRTLEKGRKVRPNVAFKQWAALRDIYLNAGYKVVFIDPVPGLPDLVFTANAGVVHQDVVVLSKFSYKERQPETPHIKKWFTEQEYTVVTLPHFFEGHGDMLFWKENIVGAYGFRSEDIGVMVAAEFVDEKKELVLLRLVNEDFYHLDTCFCPLGDKALFYPRAFDAASIKDLEAVGELIEVDDKDAYSFVCNGVYLHSANPKLIVNDISGRLERKLEKLGIGVILNRTSEFLLSGGSNRCMSLFL